MALTGLEREIERWRQAMRTLGAEGDRVEVLGQELFEAGVAMLAVNNSTTATRFARALDAWEAGVL